MFYRSIVIPAVSLVALVAVFVSGVYVGHQNIPAVEKIPGITNKESQKPATVDFTPFWKAWNVIDEHYVSSETPSDQDRVWGAISGLVDSLDDPHSIFLPPKENKIFESDISGEFQGVGMEIGVRDDVLTVIAPLKDTPAERAGIESGDKIIKIDDTTTQDMTAQEAAQRIRGPEGTDVVLAVIRDGEDKPLTISITRSTIEIPTIDTEERGTISKSDVSPDNIEKLEEVFIIRLYNFSAQSPHKFREALRKFILSNKNKLILDLRGNPGGFLEASVDIASWFLPTGKPVVREMGSGEAERRVYRSKGYNVFANRDIEMVILVNGGSASASEILAGALREHGIATLVGTQTFGKGSVQELLPITEETSLKITIARWLTPNGTSISEGGITPDVVVEQDGETTEDDQLEKAIETLTE